MPTTKLPTQLGGTRPGEATDPIVAFFGLPGGPQGSYQPQLHVGLSRAEWSVLLTALYRLCKGMSQDDEDEVKRIFFPFLHQFVYDHEALYDEGRVLLATPEPSTHTPDES